MNFKFIIPVLILFFPFLANAQEAVIGLHGNAAIERYLQNRDHIKTFNTKSGKSIDQPALQLPFFDDFTYEGPYPDSLRWQNKDAFVNTSFQKNPTNRGVATLDALDADGFLHPNASQYPFIADYLTSQKVRTDSIINENTERKLTLSDSLYLSFYYQPQGAGEAPNKHDSLILEFFVADADTAMRLDSTYYAADTLWINPEDPSEGWFEITEAYWDVDTVYIIYPEEWQRIWAVPGMALDSFYALHRRWMAPVMIPITDTVTFFREDFRFRFKNYASLASTILPGWQSNMDQWNIDYVYLNYSRSQNDTAYQDISFVDPGVSLLRGYSAMPYKQYISDPYGAIRSEFPRSYVNLDKVLQNTTYGYRIYESDGNMVGEDSFYYDIEWTKPISPGITQDSVDVVIPFPIYAGKDSMRFIIKQTLIGDQLASNRLSDSVVYIQNFSNFFAYDDGVPEAGYGLSDSDCLLAVQFPLNTRDSLQAIDIFFNSTPERQTNGYSEYFDLIIWNDNHGEPGEVLYSKDETLYGGEAGRFIRFHLDTPIMVTSGFFVGINQTSSYNINIGFDFSNNMRSRNLYKIYNNPWKPSLYDGCLMIRPVMGKALKEPEQPEITSRQLTLYPNPAPECGQVTVVKPVSFKDEHKILIDIYSAITSRHVYSASYTSQKVDLNTLTSGVYIVRLSNHTTGEIVTSKLVITR